MLGASLWPQLRRSLYYEHCLGISRIHSTPTASEPKQRGRKSQYDPETKAAIIKATADARSAGKTWADALDAAKSAGFKGSLPYLMKTAQTSGAVKVRRMRRRKAGALTSAKGKPGRPAKKVGLNGSGLGAIDTIVEQMVESRVSAAMKRAVVTLEKAAAELRSL